MEQAELIIGVHSSGESDSDAKALIEALEKTAQRLLQRKNATRKILFRI